ncbi:hypothetical protein PUNSTDRAFT_128821 [Punctularia strigosozonata HHB-11173 SS5]|uniref:uncharacterized protein n=1 Tax=Punctularia strigosozonata (strain HHB-11173) TaxID=741275 RepID=UPI0004418364|nr:uncharacterized protein PUNSTDRAFT_128821 [Punctularia strigosozonata HHB-11173 SS5]EIN13136.1 hypothetical protein PUNSTDRAFT_128821 [Punctularia strigosozonata HHB-11173 SS5]
MFKLASFVLLTAALGSVLAAPAPDTPLPYNPGGPIITTSPSSKRAPTTTVICPA